MKKKLSIILIAALAIISFNNANAQLVLPQPSLKASVMQTVGLTEITIDYSSPAVKGRTIWGELVPYDKVWRAGANSATKITFSKDVTIEGTKVPKGSYSILMLPSKTSWTVMINSDPNVSAEEYKSEKDVVKILTTPVTFLAGNSVERLSYTFTEFNNQSATITMQWEKMKISFTVNVDTDNQAVDNIEKAVGGIWSTYNNAARYYYDKKDYDKALTYVDMSIASSDKWFNNWVKAQILAAKGMNAEAYTFAAKAKELGDKTPEGFFFKDAVEKALVDWAAFAPKAKKKGK